jgi:hypothetical protein
MQGRSKPFSAVQSPSWHRISSWEKDAYDFLFPILFFSKMAYNTSLFGRMIQSVTGGAKDGNC